MFASLNILSMLDRTLAYSAFELCGPSGISRRYS